LVAVIDPLARLRARTSAQHRQLEACRAFSRLTQEDVTPADVVKALTIFHAFYDGLEHKLLPRLAEMPFAHLYRPRRSLLAADLATLGAAIPAAAEVSLPDSGIALLGVVYAVEGSALGGQVLGRHLSRCLGEDFAGSLAYFTAFASATHWQQVLRTLTDSLHEEDAQEAVGDGASLVFASLINLAGDVRPD
jgi:heme oxygenase